MVYELARDHLVCGLLDRVAELGIETVGDVDFRSSLLQNTEGLDEGDWKTLCRATDVEILERTANGTIRHIVLEHRGAYRCVWAPQ